MSQPIVTVLEFDASQANAAVAQHDAALRRLVTVTDRATQTHDKLAEAVARQQRLYGGVTQDYDRATVAANKLAAANDNAQRGFLATGVEAAELGNHLKTAALAAYALFPAFRNLLNPAIAAGLGATGTILKSMGPAAGTVATAIGSALVPALAFLSRIALPIFAITTAWQALNHVIGLGSDLLAKYGDAQRKLVANVDENLKKLTRFQDDGLSAEQVQRATELGARLIEANRTISEFSRVQLDLTNQALKLQAVWVAIVEVIAAAASKLSTLIGMIPGGLDTLVKIAGSIPAVAPVAMGVRALDAASPESKAVTQADALTAAYDRLRAGMGSTANFAVRFGESVNALQNPTKQAEEAAKDATKAVADSRTAYDRAADATMRHIAITQANSLSVGQGVAEQERLRVEAVLTDAAMRSGGAEKFADQIRELSLRAGAAAEALAKARLESKIAFERQTLFMPPEEKAIARELQSLYGPKWQENMEPVIAPQMRMSELLARNESKPAPKKEETNERAQYPRGY